MISLEKNFIFIHIPKTAGNAIQNILRKYSEDKILCKAHYQDGLERFEIESLEYGTTKHSTLNDYKQTLPEGFFKQSIKFTCTRNPWERMISFYFSPHRGVSDWNKREFIELINRVPTAMSYISYPEQQIESKANLDLDYIIDFNSLDSGFRRVCKLVDIPYEELPVRNKSSRRHYSEYYDKELVDMIAEKYQDEISIFGYQFQDNPET